MMDVDGRLNKSLSAAWATSTRQWCGREQISMLTEFVGDEILYHATLCDSFMVVKDGTLADKPGAGRSRYDIEKGLLKHLK